MLDLKIYYNAKLYVDMQNTYIWYDIYLLMPGFEGTMLS